MNRSSLLPAAFVLGIGACVMIPVGWADPGCEPTVNQAQELRTQIDDLRRETAELRAQLGQLGVGLDIVERRTGCMSSDGTDTYFTGCNVHVRDGSNDTDGPTNGLGNLVVGYNEAFVPGARRGGSHNLVIGSEHSYTSYGGLIAGFYNTVSAPHATVAGGAFNTASMNRASVTGGERNTASGLAATVSGGADNHASAEFASVTGGYRNAASASYASVSGGAMNSASAHAASVSGGSGNQAAATYASVSGGELNQAVSANASVAGGMYNRAAAAHSHVAGGREIAASEPFAAVAGPSTRGVVAESPGTNGASSGADPAGEASDADPDSEPGSSAMRAAVADLSRSAPAVRVDDPFKLPGRDFNPRADSPFAEP